MTLQSEIENAIEDSSKFSNFAQDVKMKFWSANIHQLLNEEILDEVLRIVWNNYEVKRKPAKCI